VIALFTDFGLDGPYTGQMKAALAREAPAIPVIDLLADAPPGNVQAGAYLLAAFAPWFREGTVFAAVVDPEVGSDRAALAIEADGPQGFGFSRISLDALREVFKFGVQMGIERYVTVTTASIERMVRRSGVAVTRFGPPMRIGVENAVALYIDISEQTREALFGKMLDAA